MILLNMFLSLKPKYIIKGATAQIEMKQGKLTCVSIPLENSTIKKQKLNKSRTSLAKQVFSSTT